jgi:hypothetical protein
MGQSTTGRPDQAPESDPVPKRGTGTDDVQRTANRLKAWQAVTLAVSVVVAALVGYAFASESYGFGQPAILLLIVVAAGVGAVVRRTALSVLAGAFVGYAGAAAIILRLSPDEDLWAITLGVLGSVAAIVCIPAACLASWVAGSRTPRSPDHRESGARCKRCGYNLTGNLSGVCPECGQPI